jgi:hypothetical protein
VHDRETVTGAAEAVAAARIVAFGPEYVARRWLCSRRRRRRRRKRRERCSRWIANRDDCGRRRRLCRRSRRQHTIADTARHPPSPPHGKGSVPQNAPRLLLGVSQLEAQDSVGRLDVEELMDCQTEKVRHQVERLVVRQTTLWLHRTAAGDPGLFEVTHGVSNYLTPPRLARGSLEGQAQPRRHLMLLQQQLRNAHGTRRRPEGMVVVQAGHL